MNGTIPRPQLKAPIYINVSYTSTNKYHVIVTEKMETHSLRIGHTKLIHEYLIKKLYCPFAIIIR